MVDRKVGFSSLAAVVAICAASTLGCDDAGSQNLGCADGGVAYCAVTDGQESIELCVLDPEGPNYVELQELCEEGEICQTAPDPSCVPGSGGSGGTGGTGGTGGGTASCAEIDIPGEPNLTGPFNVSPEVATFDDFVTVSVGVDGDTQEVTAILRNSSSDIIGGTGFATTAGNETVPIDVLVGTVADPGPHVVDLELRADASNRVDYVLYTSGDQDTLVRINVENDVPGPETETSCLELTCEIQF